MLDNELVIVYVTIPVDEVELELDSDEDKLLAVDWVEKVELVELVELVVDTYELDEELYTDWDVVENVDELGCLETVDIDMYELVVLIVELAVAIDDVELCKDSVWIEESVLLAKVDELYESVEYP